MEGLIGLVLVFAMMVVLSFFSKYLLAVITILTGDKKSLDDFGNLCEDGSKPKPFQQRLMEWQKESEWRRKGHPRKDWRWDDY
jgi:hypothetical protein